MGRARKKWRRRRWMRVGATREADGLQVRFAIQHETSRLLADFAALLVPADLTDLRRAEGRLPLLPELVVRQPRRRDHVWRSSELRRDVNRVERPLRVPGRELVRRSQAVSGIRTLLQRPVPSSFVRRHRGFSQSVRRRADVLFRVRIVGQRRRPGRSGRLRRKRRQARRYLEADAGGEVVEVFFDAVELDDVGAQRLLRLVRRSGYGLGRRGGRRRTGAFSAERVGFAVAFVGVAGVVRPQRPTAAICGELPRPSGTRGSALASRDAALYWRHLFRSLYARRIPTMPPHGDRSIQIPRSTNAGSSAGCR